jgi:hypothetical protein
VAKVVSSEIDSQPISNFNQTWQIILLGAILGILYCGLTLYLSRFVGINSVAGDISTILVATIGIIVMLNLGMARPLLVAVAAAISLWGLSKLTYGLGWFEVLIWSVFIYGLAYLLFAWLTRYKKTIPLLIAVVLIVFIIRITVNM